MKFHNSHYTNPGQGFFYNVYIHHDENDPFPSGWAFGQGTDPFGLPFLTVPSKGMYDQTIYHEGFHIFQYNANSPGFAYSGDTQWYIESSAQWYMANYFPNEVSTFVEAGAILGNPQLALWHSFANEAPGKKLFNCLNSAHYSKVKGKGGQNFPIILEQSITINHIKQFYTYMIC